LGGILIEGLHGVSLAAENENAEIENAEIENAEIGNFAKVYGGKMTN
jgi:hypothetical protein